MAFLPVNDFEMFYTDDAGDGPVLLFIHGTACDSHDWDFQIAHFAGTYRVLAVDLRGHGRSSAPSTGYDARQLCDDVATLIDRLGCGPVVAFGHSLGGTGRQHPRRRASFDRGGPRVH